MNYRQIAVIEYLDGFASLKSLETGPETIENKIQVVQLEEIRFFCNTGATG